VRSATRKRLGKDATYLEFIHSLPCCVCALLAGLIEKNLGQDWAPEQATPTEAAHVGERGMSQKCNDRETIPLCQEHHREGKRSHHKLGKGFWAYWRIDRDALLSQLQEEFDKRAA
jgi:hypothetical protein